MLHLRIALAAFVALGTFGLSNASRETSPLKPRASTEGRLLLSDLACAQCHRPPPELSKRLTPKVAPRLGRVGARIAPDHLRRFLADPARTKPGTTMPRLLRGLPKERRDDAIEDLVHFLASLDGPLSPESTKAFPDDVELGRQLFHQVGCVACHAPLEAAWELETPLWNKDQFDPTDYDRHRIEEQPFLPPGTLPPKSVPLGTLAEKTSVSALTAFLKDPLEIRPSGRMPSLGLTNTEAHAIALYLLKDQAGSRSEKRPGLQVEYFETRVPTPDLRLESLTPKRVGVAARPELSDHRPDEFGFRFSGFINLPAEGTWRFFTTSDDGSRLAIDGAWIVKNDGVHPMEEQSGTVELSSGLHRFEVTFFEVEGGEGLEVEWEGPGVQREAIPADRFLHLPMTFHGPGRDAFAIDPGRAARGRKTFGEQGCATCHTLSETDVILASPPQSPELARLRPDRGCLAKSPPSGAPDYALSARDREVLSAALENLDATAGPDSQEAAVARTFETFACYQCHRRDGVGGVHPLRADHYKLVGDAELGEGRVPPDLSGVGRKLHREWIAKVLLEGNRAHPHMAARMPQFGSEHVAHLVDDLGAVDPVVPRDPMPPFSQELVQAGRKLAGIHGLGCIRCHTLAGRESLGVPAVDLALMTKRLKPGWFEDLLLNPAAVRMDTRMPAFFEKGLSPVKDVLNGNALEQVQAMWTYLSLGAAMPLPEGMNLRAAEYEIEPSDGPTVLGVFMDGMSPRSCSVGFPELVHYAFDVQNSRMAKAWKGRFFNARGTWHARAGALESPPGESIYEFPQQATWALLDDELDPWPLQSGKRAGFHPRGRRIDAAGRPSFVYDFGPFRIEEDARPRLSTEGSGLLRSWRVTVRGEGPFPGLWLRAAVASKITKSKTDGGYDVVGDPPSRIVPTGAAQVKIVTRNGKDELRLFVPFEGTSRDRHVEVQIWW